MHARCPVRHQIREVFPSARHRKARGLAADLDIVLNMARHNLRISDRKTDRSVKKSIKHDLAMSTLTTLPHAEIADLVDLPRDRVDFVLYELRSRGSPRPEVRKAALAQIQELRKHIKTATLNANE